jgi:large subunit ribosomal protein L4
MSEIQIYTKGGKASGKHTVNEALASLEVPQSVLHRVVVAENANARQGTHCAKTRSEARGGGRKPYKQKKTGNARQGTIRAPHYAHGGMAHAIKPRDYSQKVNRKERRLATMSAFNTKVNDGDVIIIKEIKFAAPKTKDARALLTACKTIDEKRVLVVLASTDEAAYKSFRNIPNVEVRTAPNREGTGEPFSTRDLLVAHKIVIAADAMKQIEEAWTK